VSEIEKKPNGGQLRLLAVIELLSGNEVFGLRLKDIADAIRSTEEKASTTTILHDLKALEYRGWAQQMEDSKWRLAAKPIQVLHNFQYGLQSAGIKLSDVQQRYSRLPG
jgi:Fe2+ or Zn2+ uptake regulation protein